MTAIRVLLVDDQPLFRRGVRMLIDSQPDLTVVGEADDGGEAVLVADESLPDVVLMDIRMPNTDGIAGTAGILQSAENADRTPPRVIVLTTFDLDDAALRAIRAGASGFLLKDAEPEFLLAAIRAVHGGHAVVAPGAITDLLAHVGSATDARRARTPAELSAARDAALPDLSKREREIFAAVAEGLSNAEIAAREFVAEATVKSHVGRILAKLGLRDRVQVVLYAHDHGLLPRR
ncbi:response regulator [Microcella sp.]|uniref:response regulator n=1 Tax=Microcella sp. TaxID=1913979 RepID=UPI00256DBEDC|nr:response regulator transcription factor [Microcella sp.]MBX9471004.1 response regulator transcription factor [Microcella sp.]